MFKYSQAKICSRGSKRFDTSTLYTAFVRSNSLPEETTTTPDRVNLTIGIPD